jgi:hypothetical protein
VLLALSLLAREANVLFVPIAAVWVVRRVRPRGRALLVFVAGVLLGLLPLVARNVAVGVTPWALSNGATERIVYGHAVDSLPIGFTLPRAARSILERAEGHAGPALRLTFATYGGDWWRVARNEGMDVLAIVAGFEPTDNVNWYYFRDRLPLLRWLLRFEVVVAAGLVGLWLARRTSARHGILWWFLLASLPGMFAPVIARYRLVAVAILLVYAAAAVVWTARQMRDGRWRPAVLACVAALAVGFVSANLLASMVARLRYRSAEYILAAQVYYARAQPERTFDELRDGLAKAYRGLDQPVLPPGYLQVAGNLAGVAHRLGRDQEAAAELERTALDYPDDPDLQGLLAAVYRDGLGFPDLAQNHLDQEQRIRSRR